MTQGDERPRSTTLRGTGWLREAPTNLVPLAWLKIRGRELLRQCVFLPASSVLPFGPYQAPRDQAAKLAPDTLVDPTPPRMATPRPVERPRDVRPRRIDPMRYARIFPALSHPRARNAHSSRPPAMKAAAVQRAAAVGRGARVAIAPAWWEAPPIVGAMLVLLPPAGLAAVWSHRQYTKDAKWALTVSTMLFMVLGVVLTVALLR